MGDTSRFQPGQTVVCRQLWQNRIWQARPEIIVRDDPEMLAFFLPSRTHIQTAVNGNTGRANYRDRLNCTWNLCNVAYFRWNILRLAIPGEPYSVMMFYDRFDNDLLTWYINLEEPLTRTDLGFDYIDLFLDIIAAPDFSVWHWEDEDELEYAVNLGSVSKVKSLYLYKEGLKAINWLKSGDSPFTDWLDWQPDPSWLPPVLPDEWDTIV